MRYAIEKSSESLSSKKNQRSAYLSSYGGNCCLEIDVYSANRRIFCESRKRQGLLSKMRSKLSHSDSYWHQIQWSSTEYVLLRGWLLHRSHFRPTINILISPSLPRAPIRLSHSINTSSCALYNENGSQSQFTTQILQKVPQRFQKRKNFQEKGNRSPWGSPGGSLIPFAMSSKDLKVMTSFFIPIDRQSSW